jgi:hypothetical protein
LRKHVREVHRTELNWEQEQKKLLRVYEQLLDSESRSLG